MRNLLLLLPLLAACATANPVPTAAEDAGARVIHVKARRFSYAPDRIEIRAGEDVVLELESLDRVHGFSAPDLNVRADIEPGKVVRVHIHVDRPGVYPFFCDVFCGSGHETMEGRIVVT